VPEVGGKAAGERGEEDLACVAGGGDVPKVDGGVRGYVDGEVSCSWKGDVDVEGGGGVDGGGVGEYELSEGLHGTYGC